MPFTLFICGTGGRLAGIMQEHGETQDRFGRNPFDAADSVLPKIVAVMVVFLVIADHGPDFRNDLRQHFRVFPEDSSGGLAAEKLQQLFPDPLSGNAGKIRCHLPQGSGSGGFDRKIIDGSKAQGTENTQGILVETLFRLTDAADQVVREILLSVEGGRKCKRSRLLIIRRCGARDLKI